MDEDIKAMVEETTRQAKEVFKSSKELQAQVAIARAGDKNIQQFGEYLHNIAVKYAKAHGDNFGELFIAELDAVDWTTLVGEV